MKEVVFPLRVLAMLTRFLGPEMKSTGEVMGIDKALLLPLPSTSCCWFKTSNKRFGVFVAKRF